MSLPEPTEGTTAAVGVGRRAHTTVVDAFRNAVETAPDRIALRQGEGQLTYQEYGRCVAGLAACLERAGVADRPVALVLPNSIEMAVSIFAVLTARAQVALFNPAYTASELRLLLADAAPAAIVASPGADNVATALESSEPPALFTVGSADLSLDCWRSDPSLDIDNRLRPRANELATLMYTGGTTGVPKGVIHNHASLMATVHAMEACWPTRLDTEVWATVAPMTHIWGLLMGVLNPVYGRASVVSFPRFQPSAVIDAMAEYGISVFSGGPAAIYSGLLAAPNLASADLRQLRVCPGGGSPFPASVLRQWKDATGVEIREAYGMTEVAPITSQAPGEKALAGSVGRPAPQVEVCIASDGGQGPQPVGAVGEILVRCPQRMFRGYHRRPEDTAKALTDGWLRTGDIGRLDAEGYLYVVDRAKDMILVGGFNVFPREIDEVIASHPHVAHSVTIGVPDPRRGEQPITFIVPVAGKSPDLENINGHCVERLVKYKRPTRIIVLDKIPYTPARKVDRMALRSLFTQ
ncbi:AMP-dependent synthetase and ligase [Streptomyces bingchenggensis BCW-1]|uniref:AMP-dependent synthetase and ligase n=1 Tax=Streptomyces bingchenggensis (strain BCW-1) TaxID=749414 RepID=D7CB72_STRBB|nr:MULTISPECIES: AMP-binding protein [Streptomyces]ADI10755.1 AMP-dependent synthetase and ligase [Streptomyces bingchenggensis BCW-1]